MSECDNDAEQVRLAALHGYDVLDTPPEEQFDRITRLAKTVLQMPFVLVSLIDRDRQWFKSNQGMRVSQTPRADSFCTYTILQDEPMIVTDALLDGRFAGLPMVTGEPHIRYYIGIPLRTKSGHNIGGAQGGPSQHNAAAGAPNSQYEPNQTPAEHETELFAKDLAHYLLKAQQEGRYQHLVLSASPQFLGTLRNNLDPHVKAVIKQEFNKDYTQVPVHQLREQLQAAQAKAAG